MNIKNLLDTFIRELPNTPQNTEFPTGIRQLDEKLWFTRGNTIIVGARPSQGKSTFIMNNIAVSSAENGKCVHIYSLEDLNALYLQRYLANKLNIDSNSIAHNNLTDSEKEKISVFLDNIGDLPLYIHNDIGYDLSDIKQNIDKQEHKPDMVIIDYINKINTHGKTEYEAITNYANDCTKFAREYNIVLIICCQVGREAQGMGNAQTIHPPQLHHLKNTGALEQIAYAVIFIHWEYKYNHNPKLKNFTKLVVAKNKGGNTGDIPCCIIPEYNRIYDNIVPFEAKEN